MYRTRVAGMTDDAESTIGSGENGRKSKSLYKEAARIMEPFIARCAGYSAKPKSNSKNRRAPSVVPDMSAMKKTEEDEEAERRVRQSAVCRALEENSTRWGGGRSRRRAVGASRRAGGGCGCGGVIPKANIVSDSDEDVGSDEYDYDEM